MDEFGKTGVVPPPEKPELPATRGVVPSPDTEHVCSHASAEATQDGVLFCHREKDGRRRGTLPHKTPPFYSSQISLQRKRENLVNYQPNFNHLFLAVQAEWVCFLLPTKY